MYDTVRLIDSLAKTRDYTKIRSMLSEYEPYDIALVLEELDKDVLLLVFRLLPKELAAEAFAEMDTESQMALINSFSDSELKYVIEELYLDDAVDIIEEMPANVVKRILAKASPETRSSINFLLRYQGDSAGGIMTTEYIRLNENLTVAQAIEHIRRVGTNKETIYTCYVTKPDRHIVGVVSVKDLLLAQEDTLIKDIMTTSVVTAKTTDEKEVVAKAIRDYDFLALPIVDTEDRLVGIVTYDDAMDTLAEESEEDIQIMAAITPSEKTYLQQTVYSIWKARFPWLLILMISSTFTSLIIASFEKRLSACIVLTAYIPMLMGTGGNCGSQSSVTVIRGLSMGEIVFSDILRVVFKEFRISILCAISLSVLNFIKLLAIDVAIFGSDLTILEAFVICITLALVVITSKIVGCILPILAKKIGFDPAVMASPFITTCVDALALILYFGFASLILNI